MPERRVERELFLDHPPHLVEAFGLDLGHDPAAFAREILARLAAHDRVPARCVPEMDVADEPELLERLEVPVDDREIRRRDPTVEALRELLGRDRAVDCEQPLEQLPPRERDAPAAVPEAARRPRRASRTPELPSPPTVPRAGFACDDGCGSTLLQLGLP